MGEKERSRREITHIKIHQYSLFSKKINSKHKNQKNKSTFHIRIIFLLTSLSLYLILLFSYQFRDFVGNHAFPGRISRNHPKHLPKQKSRYFSTSIGRSFGFPRRSPFEQRRYPIYI